MKRKHIIRKTACPTISFSVYARLINFPPENLGFSKETSAFAEPGWKIFPNQFHSTIGPTTQNRTFQYADFNRYFNDLSLTKIIILTNVGVVAGFLVVHLKYTLAIASIYSILFKSNESLSPLYTMKELTNNLHKNILPL